MAKVAKGWQEFEALHRRSLEYPKLINHLDRKFVKQEARKFKKVCLFNVYQAAVRRVLLYYALAHMLMSFWLH